MPETMTQRILAELDPDNPQLATHIAHKLGCTPALVLGVAGRASLRRAIKPAFTADRVCLRFHPRRGSANFHLSKSAAKWARENGFDCPGQYTIMRAHGGILILPRGK